MEHGPNVCDAPTIQESVLQNGVAEAISAVFKDDSSFLHILEKKMESVIGHDVEEWVAEIDEELEMLQRKLIRLENAQKDYTKVSDEIYTLREQRQRILAEQAEQDGKLHRMDEMKAYLQETWNIPIEYDEQLVRKLIEKVTIYKHRLIVEFKSGLRVDVEI